MIAVACTMASTHLGCKGPGGDTAGVNWAVTDVAERPRLVAERARRAAHNAALEAPEIEAEALAAEVEARAGAPEEAAPARTGTALLGPAPEPGAQPLSAAIRAGVLLEDGRADEALVILRRALADAPRQDHTLRTLEGRALLALNRHSDARKAFDEALQVAPPGTAAHSEALYGRARAALGAGDAASAAADLKTLQNTTGDARDTEALQLLAVEVARAQGGGADTLAALRSAAEHDGRAAANLGAVLARQGDHAGAIAALRKALVDAPSDATLQLQLGTSLAATGDLPEAEAALTRSTASLPKLPQGWRNLAAVRERRGNKSGAIVAWQALLANAPEADAEGTVKARIEALRTELQAAPPTLP
jgi:tetratricopeptide (TPR) repeat protein